ncbi:MAG: FAD-binding oxidoreductase [Oligoflexia bacterium]|nr:FAD-binding oxidoreductase [Oligoflexia bacterium]
MRNFPYWLEVELLTGDTKSKLPTQNGITIIGSGLSGVSAGYWLQKKGFDDITILDFKPHEAASYRNCGHILYGTVESMKAFTSLHGFEKAKELWGYSIQICHQVRETIKELKLEADYKQDGYLVISIDETEDKECKESVELLNKAGFESSYIASDEIKKLGFKNCFGARHEKGSAQAHPVKFRNGLLKEFLKNGGKYYSDVEVTHLQEVSDGVEIKTKRGNIKCDAVVIAANAYSKLFSPFFAQRGLVEPFRGQIITSHPLKHQFKVKHPHSFDHGYEYALITEDNRLMIGGWRNHSETKEVGTFDITPNPYIEKGLQEFAERHYEISEKINWQYTWAGIMGSSSTSLPFIGPTNSDRIFSCSGYTGHGFSWAHGSALLLAQIMAGEETSDVAKYFNPKQLK